MNATLLECKPNTNSQLKDVNIIRQYRYERNKDYLIIYIFTQI